MLAAFNAFADHPIVGVGPGQYTPLYSVEYQQSLETKFRNLRHARRGHTLYFELAAETGVIGLVTFLAIPLLLLAELWRLRRRYMDRSPELAHLATAFWLSIAAYLGTAVFLHLAYERYYWFLIALTAAAVKIMKDISLQEEREKLESELSTVQTTERPAFAGSYTLGSRF